MTYLPPPMATTRHTDAASALAQVRRIYDAGLAHLRKAMQRYVAGENLPGKARACYPYVRVQTAYRGACHHRRQWRGAASASSPGRDATRPRLTRPDLFGNYYLEQFTLLLRNHEVELEVGTSNQPIPVHFSFAENDHIEGSLSAERRQLMRDAFDLPDLAAMDDCIANGTHEPSAGEAASAGTVHRAAGRLLAAPAAPLHRYRAAAFPELRAVHQLPVLHRRVRAPGPRRDAGRATANTSPLSSPAT